MPSMLSWWPERMSALRSGDAQRTGRFETLGSSVAVRKWSGSNLSFSGKLRPIDALWAAAGFVDTGLSFLSFLELYRTDVAERRMTTRPVVEPFDVVEHVSTSLLPGAIHLPGRPLGLQ